VGGGRLIFLLCGSLCLFRDPIKLFKHFALLDNIYHNEFFLSKQSDEEPIGFW
jgi:hypothetical protein